jgi:aspartyl-tRNA(Asn)/glutamyl-tRNA(Gln) amidotransferase subunit A
MTKLTSIAALQQEWRETNRQPSRLIEELLQLASAENPLNRIFTTLCETHARTAAQHADVQLRCATMPPLLGVPVVIKDNIDVAGVATTSGSKMLAQPPATRDAAVVRRLAQAGAIILGKTNLDEAALGATGRNDHFGRCINPLKPAMLTGGSSSGSAAAVAAGYALLGIGTDTLGSVRMPAALCELVGFKPSHGAISMDGIAPLYPRFDSVGIIAQSIDDVQRAYEVLRDHPQTTSSSGETLRLLYVSDAALSFVDSALVDAYRYCLKRLAALPEIQLTPLPDIDFVAVARAALWEVASSFAATTLTRAASSPFALGKDLQKLLDFARAMPDSKLQTGRQLLHETAQLVRASLGAADALLTPTCPVSSVAADSELPRSISAFVTIANITGLPAVAWPQPVNVSSSAISTMSLQLIGHAKQDDTLLQLARTTQGLLRS